MASRFCRPRLPQPSVQSNEVSSSSEPVVTAPEAQLWKGHGLGGCDDSSIHHVIKLGEAKAEVQMH